MRGMSPSMAARPLKPSEMASKGIGYSACTPLSSVIASPYRQAAVYVQRALTPADSSHASREVRRVKMESLLKLRSNLSLILLAPFFERDFVDIRRNLTSNFPEAGRPSMKRLRHRAAPDPHSCGPVMPTFM